MRPFYFRSGEYFLHFTELCLVTYPSPLDRNAPLPNKLSLLLLAGIIEYAVSSVLADLAATFAWMLAGAVRSSVTPDPPDRGQDLVLLSLFLLSFGLRTRQLLPRPGRPDALLRRAARYIFWNSPAGVCHMAIVLWSWVSGSPRLRIKTPRYFWVLIAPTLELGEVHLEVTGSKGRKSFMSILWYSLGIALLNALVKALPTFLVGLALIAQDAAPVSPRDVILKRDSPIAGLGHRPVFIAVKEGLEALECDLSRMLARLVHVGAASYQQALDLLARLVLQPDPRRHQVATRKLDAQGFRLLTILPGCGSSPVRCSLRCHSVDDKSLKYTAISYSWGNDQPSHAIIVNGQPHSVTKSAFDVLHALRSCYRSRTVWIDYICIDQAVHGDKAQQIPLMPRIYENASRVVVWLGHSKTADLATALVNRMFLVNRLRQTGHAKLPDYRMPVDAARALKRMLRTSWFTRVWVIQEVVRARRNVIIRYGDSSLSWERFSWFTQSLQLDADQLGVLARQIGHSGLAGVAALQNVSMVRRFALVRDETLSLVFYLAAIYRSSSVFDASKPHDRIYALCGLSSLSNVYLTPDYATPLRQLFVDVVRNALVTTAPRNQLAFLTHAGSGYNPTVPGLPSWAPDWTVRLTSELFIGTEGGAELLASSAVKAVMEDAAALASFGQEDDPERTEQRLQATRDRIARVADQMRRMLYDATPSTESCVTLQPDNILELKGRRVDRLIALGKPYPVSGTTHESLAILAEWRHLFRMSFKKAEATSEADMANLFFSILHQERSETRLDYTFGRMPKDPLQAYPPGIPVQVWRRLAMGHFNEPTCSAEVQEFYKLLALVLRRVCGGRRFGLTSNGSFGLFFPSNELGDWVCLFTGARLPFSIRAASTMPLNTFELVGPVYLHGYMHGILGVPNLWNEVIRLR
ncbi:uncharacterized protein UV8b_07096 [Ustilaginoidea virens]|uniref:Heterokaryon incompatibility domain-containing protein n=1 Tax=Ustilaginoidea virens TaxID=1159556 RepID=A0A8E5HWE6_USTVR|nr:uncharacterized protein UV8b_07096 [Ustilaginoidea virens]QUC22855.1 hypothetical protein UV8b_07096 [Ustilaginoidea virens]